MNVIVYPVVAIVDSTCPSRTASKGQGACLEQRSYCEPDSIDDPLLLPNRRTLEVNPPDFFSDGPAFELCCGIKP